jgi:hypothetical protein
VLAFSNSILSALAAVVLFEILFSLSRSFYLSSVFSLLFAFSATWWKFSTDADAYVPSVLLLLVCFALILPSKRGRPKLLGLAHAGAMLFHELALFFYPVAVAGILLQRGETRRQRLCRLAEYTSLTALVVGCAYWLAFRRVEPNGCFSAFGRWITYHDPSVGFAFNLGRDAIRSFRGNIHLLVATRFSAGAHHPAASVAIALSGLLLLLLGYKVARYWQDLRELSRTTVAADTRIILLALLWIVPYTAFLFFWLPQNTFYRLFYLPGVIILLCALAAPREDMTATPRRNRAALLVAAVALTNFALEILPHAPASENPTLVFAAELQKRWPAGTVVYCRSFSTNITDWTIRYFNPQTEWRAVAAGSVPVSEPELLSIYEHGHTAWFEPTASQLAADCDASAFHNWLEEHTRPGTTMADKTGGIHFVQVVPAPTSSQGRGGRAPAGAD